MINVISSTTTTLRFTHTLLPNIFSTLTIDLGCSAHFHGIGISGTLPRHIAWLGFTVHFGLNQLLARAIYMYTHSARPAILFRVLKLQGLSPVRVGLEQGQAGRHFADYDRRFSISPFHLNLSTLAFKGMMHQTPTTRGHTFDQNFNLNTDFPVPPCIFAGTGFGSRHSSSPLFTRRWIAGTVPCFPWTSPRLKLDMVSPLFFLSSLHPGRHVSLNDSHTKMKEQELGGGGLDNEVNRVPQQCVESEWHRPVVEYLARAGEMVVVRGWTGPMETRCLLRNSWRGLWLPSLRSRRATGRIDRLEKNETKFSNLLRAQVMMMADAHAGVIMVE